MPRTARFVLPGYPFHITHRGNNKETVFHTDDDRRKYLYWLEEAKEKYGMHVVAYCLMNNHVHFIAFAKDELSFAKTINTAHTLYARYFNEKNGRIGHLWQGRYYSCILDNTHFQAAVRYVERNPVRANLVLKPWEWVWSSAPEHTGMARKRILSLKNISDYLDIPNWQKYIDIEDLPRDILEIRKQTFSRHAWAEETFKDFIEEKYGIQLRPKLMGRPKKVVAVPTFQDGRI